MTHKKTKKSSYLRTLNGGLQAQHKKPTKIYDLNEANDRLYDFFAHHGFNHYPHDRRQQLAHFYQLLMKQQKKENLTRLLKFRDIAIKHFIDCLIVPQLHVLKFPLIDMGTGPGFPGIPLKIEFPEKRIILVEGVIKRVQFLKKVRDELKLKNLDIIGRYIDKDFVLPVQTVITRAVEDMRHNLGHLKGCLQTGGEAVFMKGPNVDEELKKAQEQWSGTFKLKTFKKYELPQTSHKRTLIVFERLKK